MTSQDDLHATIKAFAALDDAESVPLLTSLSIWRADIDERTAEHAAQAIALAARFDALIAAQDAFFADKLAFDQEGTRLNTERTDYAASFAALQGTLLGAAMRYRDKAAYYETCSVVVEEVE